jgi:hypothetical protein
LKKVISLIYDPRGETREAFELRMDEAVAATALPPEGVHVIV